MPVIQLPKDTRWGDLGTGLGQVIGGALEGYANKQADQSVAQIMEDPLLTEPAKLTKIMKEVPNGLERYKGLVTTQVLQATVAEKQAQAAKNQSTADQQLNMENMIRIGNGLPPKTAAPTTNVLPQAPAPVAPVAPVAAAPAATPTSVIPDVLAGGSAVAAPAETPAAAAAAPSASSATVSALGGTPEPALTPFAQEVDRRGRMGGVTFTPDERKSLVDQVTMHLMNKGGWSEAMAPVDKAIALKNQAAKFPSELASSQAGATTAAAGAVTAGAKAQVDLAEAQAKLKELETKAPYTGPKTAAETERAQQEAAANRPGTTTPAAVAATFPSFSPEQNQAVALAGQTGGPKAATAEITKIVDANAKGAGLSTDSIKFARDAASYGAITERFANEMVADPSRLGALNLSGIKARLEERGLPIGDPTLVNLLQSQKLAAATAARESGNWGVSGTNLTLSKQTSANIDKTPLSNLMMFAGTAAQKISEAEVEKAAYAGNPRAQAAIDQAVQPWRNIQKMTDTLNSTTVPVDPEKPKGAERDVMYFMGNQVNPNTMVPIVRQDNTPYQVKPREGDKTSSYTGADIFAMARAAGIDPAEMLRKLGGKP